MNTVLYDCEAIMNSRPLTYLIKKNTEITFSPTMFISDIRKNGVPDLDQIYQFHFAKRICYQQRLKEKFRKRFRIQYLGQLCRRIKPRNSSMPVVVGDVAYRKQFTKTIGLAAHH